MWAVWWQLMRSVTLLAYGIVSCTFPRSYKSDLIIPLLIRNDHENIFRIFQKGYRIYRKRYFSECKHTPGHGLLPECYHFGVVAGDAYYVLRNFPLWDFWLSVWMNHIIRISESDFIFEVFTTPERYFGNEKIQSIVWVVYIYRNLKISIFKKM